MTSGTGKYSNTIRGWYSADDLAVKVRYGYIMVLGRADDIIKVAATGSAPLKWRAHWYPTMRWRKQQSLQNRIR